VRKKSGENRSGVKERSGKRMKIRRCVKIRVLNMRIVIEMSKNRKENDN
jgi:hypothetical protein